MNGALKEEIAAIHAWTPRCFTEEQWVKEQEREREREAERERLRADAKGEGAR